MILESLPTRQQNLPKMRLGSLPRQKPSGEPHLPEEYNFVEEEEVPPLLGETYPEEVINGVFDNHIIVGMDVVVRTKSKEKRPWVGRVLEILPDQMFKIHWFGRRGRGNKFYALNNADGSAYTSILETSVVMMWEVCESKQENSFILSPVWLKRIAEEYAKYDDA